MSQFDVIVAGGGPAGTTAATLLAQYGHKVLVLERDTHPRFHIGESMLPMSEPVFKRLGIEWDTSKYQKKSGAEFINEATGQSAFFPLNGQHQPYQVERAELDFMLINNAENHGVKVQQNEIVRQVNYDSSGVDVVSTKGSYQSEYFIDATGRSAILGRKHQSIDRIDNLGKFALYTHYTNLNSEVAKNLHSSGEIKIIILDIGWFWVIPLVNKRLSLGIVVQGSLSPKDRGADLFDKYVENSPYLQKLLEGGKQETEVKTEADFSFSNQKRYGERFASCGDAAGFLDPVFSSGVFLALTSAARVADKVHEGFERGQVADPLLHADSDGEYQVGFDSMLGFVERFYNKGLVNNMFFSAKANESITRDITGLLSGDLWSGDNAFQAMLLAGKKS